MVNISTVLVLFNLFVLNLDKMEDLVHNIKYLTFQKEKTAKELKVQESNSKSSWLEYLFYTYNHYLIIIL